MKKIAKTIVENICNKYFVLLDDLYNLFKQKYNNGADV